MYENTGNGHQKMAHERMMNGQGRKVIKQRIGGNGGPQESNEIYRGSVNPGNASNFDSEWESMADRMGINYTQNRIMGGNMHGGDSFGRGGSNPAY